MTIKETLQNGQKKLMDAGILDYETDSRILLFEACDLDLASYFQKENQPMDETQNHLFQQWLTKRLHKMPVQYIIGYQEFMGMRFQVNPHVLIPRQDTETLVELCVEHILANEVKTVLDMCTGSGCIAISIKALTKALVDAADISTDALKTARKNAVYHHQEVGWMQSNLFDKLGKKQYDMIVSNPPYIPAEDIECLPDEVKNFEPRLALDGDVDGLLFYRRLISNGRSFILPGGSMYLEVGYNQAQEVMDLFAQCGYEDILVKQDLAGHDRIVYAKYKGNWEE